jgi:hypothetical protein
MGLHEGALRGRSHGWKDQRLAHEVVSVPCFELWVLVHFERTNRPFLKMRRCDWADLKSAPEWLCEGRWRRHETANVARRNGACQRSLAEMSHRNRRRESEYVREHGRAAPEGCGKPPSAGVSAVERQECDSTQSHWNSWATTA